MATQNKPVLGYRECPDCQERGTVHQAGGKRAAYLYQRCGCGADQRNGTWVQTRLWYETEWRDGMKPAEPPPNVKPVSDWVDRYGTASDPVQDNQSEAGDMGSGGGEPPSGEGAESPASGGLDTVVDEAVGDGAAPAADSEPEPEPKRAGNLWLLGAGLLAGAVALVVRGG